MIRRMMVDGKEAEVSFFKGNFEPCDEVEATASKVTFDDGSVIFGVTASSSEPSSELADYKPGDLKS